MGCDVHAYLEFSDNGTFWQSLTDSAGIRNYRMFGIMAGVREEELALFEPKGLPEGQLSWQATDAHWIYVDPEDKPEQCYREGWTTKDVAERWIAGGYSEPYYEDGVIKRVTHPDHHSHSWLTADELAQCVEKYRDLFPEWKPPHDFVGMLAAMQAIEANGGKTRLVFWFDN